jgi:hypothetical protein
VVTPGTVVRFAGGVQPGVGSVCRVHRFELRVAAEIMVGKPGDRRYTPEQLPARLQRPPRSWSSRSCRWRASSMTCLSAPSYWSDTACPRVLAMSDGPREARHGVRMRRAGLPPPSRLACAFRGPRRRGDFERPTPVPERLVGPRPPGCECYPATCAHSTAGPPTPADAAPPDPPGPRKHRDQVELRPEAGHWVLHALVQEAACSCASAYGSERCGQPRRPAGSPWVRTLA